MNHQQLRSLFDRLGIDSARPGFYDSPQFTAQERQDPSFLDRYAEFVNSRPLDDAYCAHARANVERVATFLYERLQRDGRAGACIDISMLASRFLDGVGVWNYMVAGSAVLRFAPSTGVDPKYFWHLMPGGRQAVAGHAWICAPPFRILDLSISLQPYQAGEAAHLPAYIASEGAVAVQASAIRIEEVAEPELRLQFQLAQGRPLTIRDVTQELRRVPLIGAFDVPLPAVTARYIGMRVSASVEPLSEMRNPTLCGHSPQQTWEDFAREP